MNRALFLTLALTFSGACLAQASDATPARAGQLSQLPSPTGDAVEKRTEQIRVEDAGSRIDELRVGGETQNITVQPKNGMPAYQITPVSGERSWKVLSF
jgi:hypothetical protein